MCVTGNKWTLVWNDAIDGGGTDIAFGRVTTLDGLSEGTAEPVNDSDLSTDTYERYCTPDLADQDPVTATVVFDPTIPINKAGAITINSEGHLTITSQKKNAGAATNANWAGSAMVIAMGLQEISNNVRVLRDVTFKWMNIPSGEGGALFTFTEEPAVP